ncbi:MAG: CMP deaminase [Rhodoferax sp.]|nr:CMP deaminase [Rhodoferax sp.]
MNTEALLDAAIIAARQSPNRQRRVGVVLLPLGGTEPLSACNTFPCGVQDTDLRHQGNGRLIWQEHAERNAIYAAAKAGIALDGASLASSYFPCVECARAIVQSGIRHVHTIPPDLSDPVWGESFIYSRTVLQEGGVEMHFSARDPAAVHASTMASE